MRQSRPVNDEILNVTISRDGPRWFVSFMCTAADVQQSTEVEPTLGIDLGIEVFAATCTRDGHGTLALPLSAHRQATARLRRYHRRIERRKKGSKNRRKAVERYAALHRKIRNRRKDWLHKQSTWLANAHPVIAIEDLKVAAMSASARGTKQRPGTRVSQKAGLNRAIRDQGWGMFAVLLDQKLSARGGALIKVPPANSSRTCSACGAVDAESRSSRSRFACTTCGYTQHADVNAAGVILQRGMDLWNRAHSVADSRLAAGHAVTACGGKGVSRSIQEGNLPDIAVPMKQELAEAVAPKPELAAAGPP
jgi:putative transposase